jgi:hypothetical protein
MQQAMAAGGAQPGAAAPQGDEPPEGGTKK